MAELDPKVATVLDSRDVSSVKAAEDIDEDALIASLEDDPELDHLRERRIQQLHDELAREKSFRELSHGTFDELLEEKQVMEIAASTERCVIHFYKPEFKHCATMNKHLLVRNNHGDLFPDYIVLPAWVMAVDRQ